MSVSARQNPYVGPRAFTRTEQLWGREREIAELVDLLIAERIVLLFSPSGAGKTSLLEAGLRKALEAERFHVLPTMRVSAQPGPSVTLAPGTNPYVAGALLCLDKALPPGESLFDGTTPIALASIDRVAAAVATSAAATASTASTGTAAGNAANASGSGTISTQATVLFFDQFEEVLSLNPADQARKEEFFAQVGQVLRDRNRWAIFAMREEYVAPLDPYLRPIPTRLATRYRLDLLGPAAALEAIQQPAETQGVHFTPEAATVVVNDLRRIKAPKLGGGTEETLGPHVEPVQLQVVCRRIWNALPAEATTIDTQATIGDAQEALTAYYEEAITAASAVKGVSERLLRDWFERELMTTQGLRKQVAQDAEETLAIREAVPSLLASHLIREDARRGGTWYELAHDRLVAPVRESNERWYRANASGIERQAALWDQTGRRAELLFQEAAIEEAEQWARANPDRMSDRVNAFLNESRRAVLVRATQRTRMLAGVAVGATAIIALAAGLALFALTKSRALDATAAQLTVVDQARKAADKTAAALEQQVQAAGDLVQSRYGDTPVTSTSGTSTDPGPGPEPVTGPGPIMPHAGPGETPANAQAPVKIDPKESLAAAITLHRLESKYAQTRATSPTTTLNPNTAHDPAAAPRVSIMYYTRDRDNSKLVSELEQLGFSFSTQPSRRSSRSSNCIWYGPQVKIDDVKVVALALLRAGIGLQAIKPFENGAGKESTIEIGNSSQATTGPLSVDDVERLSATEREIYARPKAAAY
jgi:hypothetical protein